MPSIVVSYPVHEGARFDEAYYAGAHTDLVTRTWQPHGLSAADILFPEGEGQPLAAMVVLRFPSQEAIDAALADPGTGAVLEDVANFTDIAPVLYRSR